MQAPRIAGQKDDDKASDDEEVDILTLFYSNNLTYNLCGKLF